MKSITRSLNKNEVPFEEEEQIDFVKWLEQNNIRFTAVPNSTYTKSWSQKRKNHDTGLRAGFPDLIVIVSHDMSVDGDGYFLCIEMKRLKGGIASKEQKEWIKSINDIKSSNIIAYVAKGSEEAKTIVSHYLRSPNNDIF